MHSHTRTRMPDMTAVAATAPVTPPGFDDSAVPCAVPRWLRSTFDRRSAHSRAPLPFGIPCQMTLGSASTTPPVPR